MRPPLPRGGCGGADCATLKDSHCAACDAVRSVEAMAWWRGQSGAGAAPSGGWIPGAWEVAA
jgi:hypothetical protein